MKTPYHFASVAHTEEAVRNNWAQKQLPPRPLPVPPWPPVAVCAEEADTKLNNTRWADPNGPRTAANASACCALCYGTSGCEHWSFQVDPSVQGKLCGWSHLTYCCWMHGGGSGGSGKASRTVHTLTSLNTEKSHTIPFLISHFASTQSRGC